MLCCFVANASMLPVDDLGCTPWRLLKLEKGSCKSNGRSLPWGHKLLSESHYPVPFSATHLTVKGAFTYHSRPGVQPQKVMLLVENVEGSSRL